MRPASNASRTAVTNTPVPPIELSGPALTSPSVRILTSSTCSPGRGGQGIGDHPGLRQRKGAAPCPDPDHSAGHPPTADTRPDPASSGPVQGLGRHRWLTRPSRRRCRRRRWSVAGSRHGNIRVGSGRVARPGRSRTAPGDASDRAAPRSGPPAQRRSVGPSLESRPAGTTAPPGQRSARPRCRGPRSPRRDRTRSRWAPRSPPDGRPRPAPRSTSLTSGSSHGTVGGPGPRLIGQLPGELAAQARRHQVGHRGACRQMLRHVQRTVRGRPRPFRHRHRDRVRGEHHRQVDMLKVPVLQRLSPPRRCHRRTGRGSRGCRSTGGSCRSPPARGCRSRPGRGRSPPDIADTTSSWSTPRWPPQAVDDGAAGRPSRTASARYGSQFRLPHSTGRSTPRRASSAPRLVRSARFWALIGDTPPSAR